MDYSEGASKGANVNLSPLPRRPTPDVITPQTPPHPLLLNGDDGGQTTPPSPFTDTSSSALALSASAASAGTPRSDLTSLPSDVSKLSLGLAAKKPQLTEPPPVSSWPYSHSAALDDIPGIAYALDTFLKSQMVESEEYCHRNDPKKCVARCDVMASCIYPPFPVSVWQKTDVMFLLGSAYTSRRDLA
jgi:hypothetical protein